MRRITLPVWAAQKFERVPHRITLERWARFGLIQPPPCKVGRAWMVLPDAKYVDPNGNGTA